MISEPDQLDLLPKGAMRILVSADLDAIKARFRARMHGVLPVPVEWMLESKHGMFDHCAYDNGTTASTAMRLRCASS